MEKCWSSYTEMQKEAKLGLINNQEWFYQAATLRVKDLKSVIHWVFTEDSGV